MGVRGEGLGLRGQFTLVARDESGRVTAMRDIANHITDAGEAEVAKLLVDYGSPVAFNYIALGLDSGTTYDTTTQLVSECTLSGAARDSDESTSTSTNVASVVCTFTFSEDDIALKEIGLLNAASDGDLLARQVFSVITVGDGDSLEATWNITCAGSDA